MTENANKSSSVTKLEISNNIGIRENTLSKEIQHLQVLIDDLIGYKLSIENANITIQQLIRNETSADKKTKLNYYISKNVELLTRIFSTIAEFENIKYRYHKEVDDVILNKFKLLAVDIRKIEEKMHDPEDGIFAFFEGIKNATSGKKMTEINDAIKDNKEYQL